MNHFESETVDQINSRSSTQVGNELNNGNDSSTTHQGTSNDQQQLHLMINIPNRVFHQDYHQTELGEQNSFTLTTGAASSAENDSFAYYYDSTVQLTPALTSSFQVDWNKVEFVQTNPVAGPDEATSANPNEWYSSQRHNLINANSASTVSTEPIVSSGSGTIKIPIDIYGGVTSTFSQFNESVAGTNLTVVNSDPLQNLHQSTPTSATSLPITIISTSSHQTVQPTANATTTTTTISTKKSSKRNQKSSGQNGNKGDGRQAKPVSAYALFFRDTQASIKAENPSASFGEISKIVASKWELLRKEEKDIYKERADLEKKNYLQNLASNKAKEIASTSSECEKSTNQSEQTNTSGFMVPTTILSVPVSTGQPQQDADLSFGESTSMTMLEDNLINETVTVVESETLNSYNAFNYHSANTYHSTLNPVMNPVNAYETSHQFDNDKVSSSFTFNESSFFDDATENIIDLGIDLNDFDDIHLLNEHIYSPTSNSMFDTASLDSNPVDFLNPLREVSQTAITTSTDASLAYTETLLSQQTTSSGYSNQLPGMIYQEQECSDPLSLEQNTVENEPFENNNNYVSDSSISLEPVESSSIAMNSLVNGRSQKTSICARSGCQRQPIDSSQWDTEFCSEECCVRYCADVFRTWTSNKAIKSDSDSIHPTAALASLSS